MRVFLTLWMLAGVLLQPAWSQSLFSTEAIRGKLSQRADKSKEVDSLKNSFQGVVTRIADSESIWVHLENKRDFQRWTYRLSQDNLNPERQEVRVWLRYVSPNRSVSRGKKYNTWFRKKVRFELAKNFGNRQVRVDYKLLERVHRLEGMVWAADVCLNLWLVQKGWSFYLIEKKSPFHEDFVQAEKLARERQLGLWKPPKRTTKQG